MIRLQSTHLLAIPIASITQEEAFFSYHLPHFFLCLPNHTMPGQAQNEKLAGALGQFEHS